MLSQQCPGIGGSPSITCRPEAAGSSVVGEEGSVSMGERLHTQSVYHSGGALIPAPLWWELSTSLCLFPIFKSRAQLSS